MTELIPETGVELNSDAVHPPFKWQVALPTDWAVLDTRPSSWQRSADRLVDERMAGQRMRSADRRAVLHFLGDLVATCQRGGTLISLVQVGRMSTGAVGSAGLHLAWYDSTPEPASLATIRRAVGRQGTIEEVETEAGIVLLQREHMGIVPPVGRQRVNVASIQAFLPVSKSCWTAVVATACAHPEMHDMLDDLVRAVVSSIHVLNEEAATSSDAEQADMTYTEVGTSSAPGIERGFGTLVLRRIEGEGNGAGEQDE